jgi:hypothetical protein
MMGGSPRPSRPSQTRRTDAFAIPLSTKLAAEPDAVLPIPGTVHEVVPGYGRGLGGLFIRMIVVVPRAVIFWMRA